MNRFTIQSDESEILLHLETASNLREVAEKLGKDVSVISRRLQTISEKTPFLLKQDRQWKLTESGRKYNHWTKKTIAEQHDLIKEKERLVLATTREFSNIVLCSSISWWLKEFSNCEIMTTDEGIESMLLKGSAHFGFDCGIPYSPQIAFKKGPKEEFGLVYHSKQKVKKMEDLKEIPFFHYNRIDLAQIRTSTGLDFVEPKLSLSDMTSTRSALLSHEGWSVLPSYAVTQEVASKKLQTFTKDFHYPAMNFGLWWNRENAPQQAILNKAFDWLQRQKL